MKLRHKKILEFIRSHNNVSSVDISKFLNEQDLSVSEPTLARDLNKLIELGVPESIADFIQGRASVTVGSTHYLNKTKQADN